MSAMSNYLEGKFIDFFFRNNTGSVTAAHPLYLSLHTASPGETGASNECSGGSYARTSMGASPSFNAATDGVATNKNDVTFPTPTVSWGTVTHFAIWDASSAGNCLTYGALTSPSSIVAGIGVVITFAAGSITITAA